jgi:hypothetical protein
MEKIFIAIFLCLSTAVNAQSSLCPALQQFGGEWRYVNGQDTIRVFLRSNDYIITGDGATVIAKLWGWHEYKQGNVTIESNYSNRFMTLPTNSDDVVENSYSISLQMPQCDISQQRLIGEIDDITQCYESKVVTIIFNLAQTQLSWKQIHPTGFGFKTGCKGMTLPGNFVLTKQ